MRWLFVATLLYPFSVVAAVPAPTNKPNTPVKSGPNSSQSLTRAALISRLDAQFRAIDTDGDGTLSQAELAAAEQTRIKASIARARARLEAEFAKLDTNKDGQLTMAEFMAAAPEPPTIAPDVSAAFARLDANNRGKVTASEFTASAAARFDQMDAKHAGVLNIAVGAGVPRSITRADFLKQAAIDFATIDAAHRGFITKADLAAAELKVRQQRVAAARARMQAEFNKLDTKHEGKLSLGEFMAAAPQAPATAPNGADWLARLDKKHDGKITLDEFRAPALQQFDRLDKNHDGVLTPDEMRGANVPQP